MTAAVSECGVGGVVDGRGIGARAAGSAATERVSSLALRCVSIAWVVVVLTLALTIGSRVEVTPLLAAAPVVGCAASGRRQCVLVGLACALLALLPIADGAAGMDQRIGTAFAIVAVAAASYLVAHRHQRLRRDYEHVNRIADVTQRILLRPIPRRLGTVSVAVDYISAVPGARIGGDFYDVLETPFGLRAVLGDVRGSGLDAVAGAAALLGAFREAASYEAGLDTVALRLGAALVRLATVGCPTDDDRPDLRAEDFATAVLVEISEASDVRAGGAISVVSCGHPVPYLLRPRTHTAESLDCDPASPPLGLHDLDASGAAPAVYTAPFAAGSTIVLCTDGILDARDGDGEFFPIGEVLGAAVLDAVAADSPDPADVVSVIRERLITHTKGRLRDDAAVLVLGRTGE